MDIGMPLMDGIKATETITNTRHSPKVLIISQYDEEEYIRNCMKAGASGYLLKDGLVSELSKAIRVVHADSHSFRPRVAQRIVGFYLKQVVSAQHDALLLPTSSDSFGTRVHHIQYAEASGGSLPGAHNPASLPLPAL